MTNILKQELKRPEWEAELLQQVNDRVDRHPGVWLEVSSLLNSFNQHHEKQKEHLQLLAWRVLGNGV